MRLSFDMDGVLADGQYVPEEKRTPEFYLTLAPISDLARRTVNALSRNHTVYIISSRHFADATRTTQQWLWRNGFILEDLAGVLCGIPIDQKVDLCNMLGVRYHVDDDPAMMDYGEIWNDFVTPLMLRNPSRFNYKSNISLWDNWDSLHAYFCHLGLF